MSSNTDFRISIGFFSNPKTRRLKRRHGAEAVLSLIALWEFTAKHRPKGILYGMDAEDIVDVCGWGGDTEFVDSLLEFGLIEKTADDYVIHDWQCHNGWAFHAEERTEKAKKAAEAKWAKERQKNAK